MSNPLVELQKLGQSIWYDNIRKALLVTGDLQAKIGFDMKGITSTLQSKIGGDDLRGVTSNPSSQARSYTSSPVAQAVTSARTMSPALSPDGR